MEASKRKWFYVRLLTVSLSSSGGVSIHRMPGDFAHPSFTFALIFAGLCAFGLAFVRGIQFFNAGASATWQRPSWFANPFKRTTPLEQFHLGGWCLIAAGLGSIVLGLLTGSYKWAWELPVSAGVGVLIGVRFVSDPGDKRDSI